MRRGFRCVFGSFPARNLKFLFAGLLYFCTALFATPDHAQSLNFYKNYFVTGDYAVAGVGLYGKGVNGVATGAINMSSVPAGADIIAAYLYWETVETTAAPSNFNGKFDGNAIVGASLGDKDEPACGVSGGTSPQVFVRGYRADVLRYLPIDSVNSIRLVDGNHTVMLADSGANVNGTAPHTYGASLVVIYRILKVGAAPLKAVVIYDGDYTMSKRSSAMFQFVSGFYQATGGANANMTQIVGDGQPGFNATLSVNGSPVSSSPFVGALGGRWDNYTFPIGNYVKANNFALETQTLSAGNQVCLSWAAVVTSMNVVNSDGDGILDVWKNSGFLNSLINIDPTGEPLPDLEDMGAKHGQKDVFIQIDWMQGTDGHLHVPKLAALTLVANAFSAHGVKLHFDVGNNYQQTPPLPYIVPAKYAQGGSVIPESSLLCPNGKTSTCSFPEPYSVLSWKKGFLSVKNGFPVLNISPHFEDSRKDIFHEILMGHAMAGPFDATGKPKTTNPSSVSGVADRPGGDLMITLGLWRTDNPANCVQSDPTGKNTNICTDQTGTVLVQAGTIMHELGHNLGLSHGGLFRVPNCMPDYPSVMNYLYQTRGLTDDLGFEHIDYSSGQLGPLNENALSEMTSLGNSIYRIRFYGPPSALSSVAGQTTAKAHCDGTPLTGDLGVRLETPSHSSIPDWNNNGKVDADTILDINFNGYKGDPVQDSVDPTISNGKRWFVDTNDWANLNLQQVGARLNVNGLSVDVGQSDLGQSDLGQSDLGQSDLGQSDLGQSDLGQSDLGQSDLGQSDLGDVDYDTAISTLDATGSTTPLVATVSASTGTVFNQITLTWGPPSLGQIRTYNVYRENLSAASPQIFQVVPGVSGTPPATTFTDMVNDFSAADSGKNCPPQNMCYNATYQYFITAVDANGTTSAPSNFATATVDHLFVTAYTGNVTYGNPLPDYSGAAATVTGLPTGGITSTSFTCTNTSPSGTPRNVGSYTVTCTGPTAVGTGSVYGVTYIPGTLMITSRPLTITAGTLTKTYDGTMSAAGAVATVSGLAPSPWEGYTDTVSPIVEMYKSTNVMGPGGSTLYVSSYAINDENGGENYSVTLATTSGTISARPIAVTAVMNSKVYDGMNSASAVPSITSALNPPIVAGDTPNFIETYSAGKNVGTGLTLAPSGSVSDGNSGNNYAVTFANNATGIINARPITVTAVTTSKVYDGTKTASQSPVVTSALNPPIVAGDTANFFEAYSSQNVMPGLMLIPFGSVSDGNRGINYAVTLISVGGTITAAPLTITAVTSDKTYDGTTSSAAIPTYSPLAGAVTNGDTISGLAETYDTPNAGTGKTMTVSPSYTINDGNNNGDSANYAVKTVTNTSGEIDTLYKSDATLADFTNALTNYATFNTASGSDMNLPYTPTAAILDTGDRVVGSGSQPIVVQFTAPVSGIRVFPNIDHYGSSFDGFQYSISGSNDGVNWTPLFNATSVTGTGEPFTLGTFTGTEPNVVNNVLTSASSTGTGTGGVGSGGTIGYVADFVFSQAYTYFSFGPSTVATNSENTDQELSGVAALP